jgi:hypothetical protein
MNETRDYKILIKNFNKIGGRTTLKNVSLRLPLNGTFNCMSETRA